MNRAGSSVGNVAARLREMVEQDQDGNVRLVAVATGKVTDALTEAPPAHLRDPAEDHWPLGIEPGGKVSMLMEIDELKAQLAEATARVADLEHENRRLERAVEQARVEGEQAANSHAARTHNGRVPSILGF